MKFIMRFVCSILIAFLSMHTVLQVKAITVDPPTINYIDNFNDGGVLGFFSTVAGVDTYQFFKKVDNGPFELLEWSQQFFYYLSQYDDYRFEDYDVEYYKTYSYYAVAVAFGEDLTPYYSVPSEIYTFTLEPYVSPPDRFSVSSNAIANEITWVSDNNTRKYNIFRKSSSDSEFSLLATLDTSGESQYLDGDVIDGDVYSYYVTCSILDKNNNIIVGPATPTITITASNNAPITEIISIQHVGKIVELAIDSSKPDLIGYDIYRKQCDDCGWELHEEILTTFPDVIYIYTDDTTYEAYSGNYWYRVKAIYNKVGETIRSNYSSPQNISVVESLEIPTSLAIPSTTYNSLELTWDPVDYSTGYEFYRSSSSTGTYSLIGTQSSGYWTSYIDPGLVFNTIYYYKVRAYYTDGASTIYGGFSSIVSGKTSLPPVTDVSATSSNYNTNIISWYHIDGASGYEIYYSTGSSTTYILAKDVTTIPFTHTALLTNTQYNYKVRAYRLVGTTKVYGAFSAVQSVRPLPAAPVPTATSVSYNSLKVSWLAVDGASGYEVSYLLPGSTTYIVLSLQTTTTYTLLNQATNGTVFFKVRAYRLVGTTKVFGSYSPIVSAKPIPATPALTVASDSYNRLKISWATIAGASGYELYHLNASSGLYELLNDGTGLSYLHPDLISGVNHSYKVKAYTLVNSVKVYSNYSAVVTNKAIPSIPASPKAVYANYNSITVSTAAVTGATGYELYRSTSAAGTYALVTSPTATSYTNTGLAFNTTYYYKVRAYTLVGTTKVYGNYTAVVFAKTTLNTPVATAVSASYNSNRISWATIAGITNYELYRSSSYAGTYYLQSSLTTTSYTHPSLLTNTTYYYKVRAYRLVGTVKVYSAYSAVVSARPVPSAPVVTSTNLGYNSVKASWAAVSGANGYEVSKAFGTSTTYGVHTTTTALTTTLTGLTTNLKVSLKVRSYRMVGSLKVFGPYSTVSTVTPYPLTPVLNAAVTPSSISLIWTAVPGITKYIIYHDGAGQGTYEVLGESLSTSFLHEGLILGSVHAYKIVGSMMVGTDELLTPASAIISRTVAVPAVTGLLASSPAYDRISLKWNTSVGSIGYEVSMATTSTGVYTVLGETDQLTYLKTALAFNTTYYFKVRPYSLDGETKVYGAYASIVSAKTTVGTPILTSKNVSATSINLSWAAIPGASGYEIYRATTTTGIYTLQTTTGLVSYTKTLLIKGTVYYYKVRAYRLVGTVKVYGAYSALKYVRVGY